MMPSGTATITDSTVDASTSGALTVSFSPSWLVTVSPFSADVPKSPWRMPPIQSRYCTTSGRLSPSSSRMASICSGVAWVPPMTRARSPGSSRRSRKTTMLVTTIASSSRPSRRSTYSVIGLTARRSARRSGLPGRSGQPST